MSREVRRETMGGLLRWILRGRCATQFLRDRIPSVRRGLRSSGCSKAYPRPPNEIPKRESSCTSRCDNGDTHDASPYPETELALQSRRAWCRWDSWASLER
ncbi:hypothetical protein PMAYCL1PPCAC_17687 [Pristionchus mayeri]|uniref:Uncharacterized protein n=1 Tax=Pristionchus mayeri TaxID=1317129 RepID=A0AAN5CN58_9BILA|nr:hypothetical protein PMAYCL1PPCAC_17687 [Pristionchus mayeri]